MKKALSIFLAFIFIFSTIPMSGVAECCEKINFQFFAVKAKAASEEWSYTVLDDGTASITRYNGESENVTIPSSIDGYTVSSFGEKVFYNCVFLKSAVIPDTVDTIGKAMFYNCTALESVSIPNTVTVIPSEAFYNCVALTTVSLPSAVTTISSRAFYSCTALAAMSLPETVTTIGDSAFAKCPGLTEMVIPAAVTTISSSAFAMCDNLAKITISDLEAWFSIDFGSELANPLCNGADFYLNETKITELTIPESITHIKKYVLCGSKSVNKVIIHSAVTSIEDRSFFRARSLQEFDVSVDNSRFVDIDGILYSTSGWLIGPRLHGGDYCLYNCPNGRTGEVVIPDDLDITIIGKYAFYDCDEITSVIFPDSMLSVDQYAFTYCSNLKTIDFGKNLNTISAYAFEYCTALEAVELPDTLTVMDIDAFYNCSSVKSLNIGSSLKYLPNQAFSGCKSLKTIKLNDVIERFGQHCFNGCGIETLDLPASLETVRDNAFTYCANLTSVVFRGADTKVEGYVFSNCSSLRTAVYPENMTVMPAGTFSNCPQLDGFVIPKDVTIIENHAFYGCSSLSAINIPDKVTSIGVFAFYDCSSLAAVDLSKTAVESIGLCAFEHCTSLKSAILSNTLKTIENSVFDYCSSLEELRFPASLESTYTTFDHTNSIKQFVVDENNPYYSSEDGVLFNKDKTILYNYPSGATRTEYFVPKSVVVIEANSFFETAELTEITILDNVTTISDKAYFTFYGHDPEGDLLVKCLPNTPAELYAKNRGLRRYILHYYTDWEYDVEPTCTTSGTAHRVCTDCGEVEYRDFDALGHNYSPEWTVDVAASCTVDGVKSHHCTRVGCDSVDSQTAIPATGHNFSEAWTVDIAATCLDNGSKSHHCINCEAKTDDTVIFALGHIFGGWVINKEPTCTDMGSKTHYCEACEYSETFDVEALGHNYSKAWTIDTPSSCTKPGSKSHHCLNCDEKSDVTEIPAGEHQYGIWTVAAVATCTEEGLKIKVCEICGDEISTAIPATGHDYATVWTIDSQASCTQTGIKSHHCLICDARKDVTRIAATGHSFGTWIIDVEETCTEYGKQHRVCASCEETEQKTVSALGHHYSKMWTVDIESTCTAMGEKSHHCLRCDDRTDISPIDYSGHIFGPWYVEVQSTLDSEGVRAHDCYNCDLIERDLIPQQARYIATFKADGETVATVAFPIGAKSIDEPEVPIKDKYTGVWSDYVLGDTDITVNAIYTPIESENINNIVSDNNGTYSNGVVNVNIHTASPSRTVVTSSSTPVPLDIVLVLDQSGSMEGAKKTALVNAVTEFSNTVLNDSKEKNVVHKIALVGFGMGQDSYGVKGKSGYIPAYENTEILSAGNTAVAYNKANTETYQSSLVAINENGNLNSVIANAINDIDARGATRADLGLEMAAKIFANNDADGRQRVVVFFTDGEPTSSSDFEYSVANSAIANAYQIKDIYKANIYSVGIFDKATASNTTVQTFMDAVSSNKLEDIKLSSKKRYAAIAPKNFYITVDNTENLSAIFTSIAKEAVIHTGLFDNLTIVETISDSFSLTSAQENELRINAKNILGVDNGDIAVTRKANGTTRIEIKNVHPQLVNEEYVADISFNVTANEKTLYNGIYNVNTLDSGVKVDGGENYEAVFAPMKVSIDGCSGIAVFNVNNVPYVIERLSSSDYVMAPAVDFDENYTFSGWDIPENCKLNNKARVFDSTLTDNEYTVTWHINGEIVTETYGAGDVITVPTVNADEVGGDFSGWDGTIPETMPDEDLVFTAVYNGAHYHKYEAVKEFTSCTRGGKIIYTCECGDIFTETIEPHEHTWVANSGAASEANSARVGFRCTECGSECDNNLEYIRVNKGQSANGNGSAVYEFDFVDANGNKGQPADDVIINVSLEECFENEVPNTSNGKAYRDNGDGTRTSVSSRFDGMNACITTNHFSTYIFEFDDTEKHIFGAVNAGTEIDYENGFIFSAKRAVNELASIVSYLLPWNMQAQKHGTYFGTGSAVKLTGETDEDYTVIITGDINGDGVCDVLDVVETEKVLNGHGKFDKIEAYAVNGCANEEILPEAYGTMVNLALAG